MDDYADKDAEDHVDIFFKNLNIMFITFIKKHGYHDKVFIYHINYINHTKYEHKEALSPSLYVLWRL